MEGLKIKYNVYKIEDGLQVNDCFVLRPIKDVAAREASKRYAEVTENKELANDILKWIGESNVDTVIRVRCIDSTLGITKGKEYIAIGEDDKCYRLEEDDMGTIGLDFFKERFEKVEDTLMVECIWSDGTVTGGMKYPVIEERQETYLLKNDLGEEKEYYITDFKLVEPQKEVKEYLVNHTLTYAEEQLEHAKEEKTKCYSKECPNNKGNKCVQYCDDFSCLDRIANPINYEEEYKKLKEENKKLINTRDELIKANKEISKQSAKNYDDYKEHLKLLQEELKDTKIEYLKKYQKETEEMKKLLENQKISIENCMKDNVKLKENLKTREMRIEFLECAAEKTKEKLENYELLKRMIKVLIEGL